MVLDSFPLAAPTGQAETSAIPLNFFRPSTLRSKSTSRLPGVLGRQPSHYRLHPLPVGTNQRGEQDCKVSLDSPLVLAKRDRAAAVGSDEM